ncbi:autotransporter domain-containing protein [Rhodobacteraceae bacterium M385]|nr:autotransporter domain-containing protein [Rhodobacteraceae bacterium M385]
MQSGTVTLSGANTYGGATTVADGTLRAGNNTVLWNRVLVIDGTLNLNGYDVLSPDLSGTGIVTSNPAGLATFTFNGAGTFDGSFQDGVNGVVALEVNTGNASNTFTVNSADSTDSGSTTITTGTFVVNGGNAIGDESDVSISGAGTLRVLSNETIDSLSGAGSVDLDASTLTIAGPGATSFSGVLSGSGGLSLTNSGNLTLSGNNTYSGATTITGGTLAVTGGFAIGDESGVAVAGALTLLSDETIGSLSGTGMVSLNANTLTLAGTDTTAFSGVLSGTGGLSLTNAGTLTLSGVNSYTGNTSVSGGTLLVDGQIASPVSVSGTGVIGGSGGLGQLTVNGGGTIAPGNSIGTVTVVGDASLASGSTFALEVDGAGNADLLAATGNVTIDSGATLAITSETAGEDGSTYPWNNSYTFITAGSVSGTFGIVTSSLSALDASVTYTANSAVLTLARNNIDLTSVATTPNQIATAELLNGAGPTSPVTTAIWGAGEAAAPTSLNLVSGEIHASGQTHLLQASQLALGAAPTPGSSGGAVEVSQGIGGTSGGSLAWGTIFGAWYENRSDGVAATMDGTQFGVFAGTPLMQDASRSFGVMLGFTESSFDVDGRASTGSTSGAHFGLYGSAQIDPITLSYSAVYSDYAIETQRNVAAGAFTDRLGADYGAAAFSVSVEASYGHYINDLMLQPFAGLSYTRLEVDGFAETGGAAALTVAAASHDLTTAHLGVRFAREVTFGNTVVEANGSLGYHHVFGDTSPLSNVSLGGSPSVNIAGVPLARDSFTLGLGAAIQLTDTTALSMDYIGELSANAQSYRANLTFEIQF